MDLDALVTRLDAKLAADDARRAADYPGDRPERQPVHTVYVAADRIKLATPAEYGREALRLLDQFAPDAPTLAEVTGLDAEAVHAALSPVRTKLVEQPIEDLRIDFEDGYGRHGDADEDDAAIAAGQLLTRMTPAPLMAGIRIRSLEPATRRRAVRTLDLVLTGNALPARFVVTLPKVTSAVQVEAMVEVCVAMETRHGLAEGAIRIEAQIETPQAVLGPDGTATAARIVHSGRGRLEGLHYGTYDYSAALGITAGNQSLAHPAADHAKAVLTLAAAGTGVRVSDGSTNVVPAGANTPAVWRLHAGLVTRSLERGIYQGWDLHPGHLPTRFLANQVFFGREYAAAAPRLAAYVRRTANGVLDEPATAQALAFVALRALDCGAVVDPVLGRDVLVDLLNRR